VADKDLYKILGVDEKASAGEIKKAFREQAKKNHPDRTGGDKTKEQRFKEINAAYEVLSDPKRRQQYDAMRRGGFGGDGGMPDISAFQGIDGIEELFGSIFGARGFGGGGSRVVYETRPFTGFGGGGSVFDFAQTVRPRAAPSPVAEESVRTRHGHPVIKRGDDIHSEVEVSLDEAILGAKVEVPTLDGHVTITVPPGSSSGRQLRLRGKGVGGRGNHYVSVKIVVPDNVDKRTEELVRELARRAPVKLKR
jgi:DnaJ-class molecular chaperone